MFVCCVYKHEKLMVFAQVLHRRYSSLNNLPQLCIPLMKLCVPGR